MTLGVSASSQPAATLLLVTSDANPRQPWVAPLQQAGYRVNTVATGQLALAAIQRRWPDLVLVVNPLSDMAVAELCRQGQAQGWLSSLPVVVLAPNPTVAETVAALNAGVVDYVTWPCDGAELLARVQRHHHQSRDLRRLQAQVQRWQLGLDGLGDRLDDRLLKLAAQVPGVIYQYRLYPDGSSCFPFASDAIRDIYGVAPEQVQVSADPVLAVLHPDDVEALMASIQASAATLTPWHWEYRVQLPEQGVRWLEGNAKPERLPDGSVLWHGFIHDISDRKAAEAALQTSEATQRAILSAIPDLLVRLDRHGTLLDCLNSGEMSSIVDMEAFQSAYGRLPHTFDIMPRPMAERRMKAIQAALATGIMQRYQQPIEIDGVAHYEESRVMRIGADQVLVMIRDITDRVQAEQQVKQKLAQEQAIAHITGLVHSSLDLEAVLAQTVQALWQLLACDRVLTYRFNPDWSGEIVAEAVAPGWTPLLGIPDPALAQALDQTACLTQVVTDQGLALPDTYLQDTQGRWDPANYGVRVVHDVAVMAWPPCYRELMATLQARAYLIAPIYSHQTLWGLLCLYQNHSPRHWQDSDIHILTQAASQVGLAVQKAELFQQVQQKSEELATARDTAEAANRAKSAFLANMSHELRTPLNAILGFAQVLQQEPNLAPAHQKSLQTILRSGEHLLDLINEVLDLSKIEAGRMDLQPQTFHLPEFLETLQAMLAPQAQGKGLAFTLQRTETLPPLGIGDQGKLRQVLINLLGNAIKFTRQGTVTLRVLALGMPTPGAHPSTDPPPANTAQSIGFEVVDTGIGIDPSEQYRIFNAFEQTALGKITPHGTGLGLTISCRLVEMMGGQLMLCSTPGQGSTFRVVVPLGMAIADQAAEVPRLGEHGLESRSIQGLAPQQPTYRILVVDDQPLNRQVLVQLLQPLGFEVLEAVDGAAAIAQWQTTQPHLMLLDMRMAGVDGYDTLQAIRAQEAQQPQRPPVKIIAVTATVLPADQERAIALGCDDWLSKPVQRSELLAALARHLALRYTYTDLHPTVESPETVTTPLDWQDLTVMTDGWVRSLHDAVLRCNDYHIETLLEDIPAPHQRLRNTLQQYTEQFQLEAILALTEAYLTSVRDQSMEGMP
ncbi:MAG: response regulator [Leptolyngbya sp.]|nr:response regulator [Leptolyngbya sp.]